VFAKPPDNFKAEKMASGAARAVAFRPLRRPFEGGKKKVVDKNASQRLMWMYGLPRAGGTVLYQGDGCTR